MKETMMYLSSIKPRYFMLLVYLFLLAGATSCRDDHFESDLTDDSIQLSKAELIQQALRRLLQTRVEGEGVMMITIKDTVNIKVRAAEAMEITWGDHSTPDIIMDDEHIYSHVYTDGYLSHAIYLSGSAQALRSLTIDNNGLILLNIYSNESLTTLSCVNNHLENIDLKGCPNLYGLNVSKNELTLLDVSNLFKLESFYASHNQLTALDFSNNANLYMLEAEHNPLKELNLQENAELMYLYVSFTQLKNLDLSKSIYLSDLFLENTPIEIINNQFICNTSFAMFKDLWQLNVAYTSFSSLDLSCTPQVYILNISGTPITQLDISELKIQYFVCYSF